MVKARRPPIWHGFEPARNAHPKAALRRVRPQTPCRALGHDLLWQLKNRRYLIKFRHSRFPRSNERSGTTPDTPSKPLPAHMEQVRGSHADVTHDRARLRKNTAILA